MDNKIFLIGFMGVGKTTQGRSIAWKMKRKFIDMDEEVKRRVGMSIGEYFDKYGEESFRQIESEVLQKLEKRNEALIISTGGGLVIKEENRKILKSHSQVVWLRAKSHTIQSHLESSYIRRPLLEVEDPISAISQKLEEREAFYTEVATLIIDVDDKTQEEVESLLLLKLI